MSSRWSKKHDQCVVCKSVERKFMAKGMCSACYLREYANKPENLIRREAQMKRWYPTYRPRFLLQQKVTREELHYGGNREAVLARDGYACTRCGSTGKLVVHHKDGKGRGHKGAVDNSLDNLQTVCRRCHLAIHENVRQAKRLKFKERGPFVRVKWSRKHDKCLRCGTSSKPHGARGYCRSCLYFINHERMR